MPMSRSTSARIAAASIRTDPQRSNRSPTDAEVAACLREALASGRPALIDCVIDPSDGTESGNIAHLNPKGITNK